LNSKGGFFFSQAVLPRLITAAKAKVTHPPTLIFTGATASLKGSAMFASFAVGKFATRALVQSLSREFGPQGVHVSHAIIDGVIDLPGSANYLADAGPDAKINTETVSILAYSRSEKYCLLSASYRLRTHIGICILSQDLGLHMN
jgi:NAD(P)-dependent dehydrogenase (short-subunit alcohol dehydrogenase family)